MKGKLLLFILVAGGAYFAYEYFKEPVWAQDDAMEAGLTTADFPHLSIDLFAGMDPGHGLSPEEIQGRNDWNAWTAGNQSFWDEVARTSFGLTDLLKTIDSRGRGQRFSLMGLISEPDHAKAQAPDEYGLWIDTPTGTAPEGWNEEWERVYGRSSGVMGLRLYPNPAFDDEAREAWDSERYYNDRTYYTRSDLVRPYRVGMACGFCHIAFDPLNPPQDPEEPDWTNLRSTIGNQYLREGPAFMFDLFELGQKFHEKAAAPVADAKHSFFKEMLELQPPGTSDTSRVATDHINNPNNINPIFNLEARLSVAVEEELSPDRPHVAGPPFAAPKLETALVPHVLKDGADSVGVPGATIRVFVNIGLFSQYWLQLHNKLVGLGGQQPFSIEHARESSVYWQATEERLGNIAKFLMTAAPLHLEDAPGGMDSIDPDPEVLRRGALLFAQNCAQCHSSKQPPEDIDPDSEAGQRWYEESVLSPDFREGNFLSNDQRYPVTRKELRTNAARALATNAARGNVWDNFSSETYKDLPSVGKILCYDPETQKETYEFEMPGGGRGYYRTPSLVSIWTSAPFLHNNTLGEYTGDPSVAGRMRAFEDAAAKLLGLEERGDVIWRTREKSWLRIPEAVLPQRLRDALSTGEHFSDGSMLEIGPIPAGTPVNLLGSLDPDVEDLGDVKDLVGLAIAIKKALWATRDMSDDDALEHMRLEVAPLLMKASKCPDLVMDKGHTFGTLLEPDEKHDLIEFLKTL